MFLPYKRLIADSEVIKGFMWEWKSRSPVVRSLSQYIYIYSYLIRVSSLYCIIRRVAKWLCTDSFKILTTFPYKQWVHVIFSYVENNFVAWYIIHMANVMIIYLKSDMHCLDDGHVISTYQDTPFWLHLRFWKKLVSVWSKYLVLYDYYQNCMWYNERP